MRVVWWSVAVTLIGLGLLVMLAQAAGCYPQPPINPPSCAQDPTQPWCAPPAFTPAPTDGGRG